MAKSYDLCLQKSFIVDVWKLLNTPTYAHYRAILISMSHNLKDDFEDFFFEKMILFECKKSEKDISPIVFSSTQVFSFDFVVSK